MGRSSGNDHRYSDTLRKILIVFPERYLNIYFHSISCIKSLSRFYVEVVQVCKKWLQTCFFGEVLLKIDRPASKLKVLIKGQKKATVSCHTPNRVYTK